jgi:glycerol uptake facilitator-like aquaporin
VRLRILVIALIFVALMLALPGFALNGARRLGRRARLVLLQPKEA